MILRYAFKAFKMRQFRQKKILKMPIVHASAHIYDAESDTAWA